MKNSNTKKTRQPRSEVSTARFRKTMAEERVKKNLAQLEADRKLIAEMKEIILANGEAV